MRTKMALYSHIISLEDAAKFRKLLTLNSIPSIKKHFIGYLGKNYVVWAEENLSQLLEKNNIKCSVHKISDGG